MARKGMLARREGYHRQLNLAHSPMLAYLTPWLSIMLASYLPSLPIASAMPLAPPLGFVMLLGWRYVRPGLLPPWAGVPLGLFDDLFSGQPLGSAILVWSLVLIAIEFIEMRFPWHGFFQDWAYAALFIVLAILAGVAFSGAPVTGAVLLAVVPQLLLSVLLFPIVARMVASLDRLRLIRFRLVQ
ncbi:MAG: rod shape-determining protein MreD [Sphingomonadales bacterium]|nr:rod shape-determining protein MreD [Sphingomonadales bacterium]MBD3773294.1 rod shape-determining protein MreD [Paracoccaceae bacterium]